MHAPPAVCLTRVLFSLVPMRFQGPKPHRKKPKPAVRKDQESVRLLRRHTQWPRAPIVPSNVTICKYHVSREAMSSSIPHVGLRSVQASMHMMPWPCLQRAETVFCICFLHTRQSVRPIGKPRNQCYLLPLHYLL